MRTGESLAAQGDAGAEAPRRLHRYELFAPIGQGGMGVVYLARAEGMGGFERIVAVKCCHEHLAHDEEFVAMFLDEARLAARIHHPNVVATLDVNRAELLYLVMDYVEGGGLADLQERLGDGEQLPLGITLRIVVDALNGLHAAHALRDAAGKPLHLVHRDVSPHNILVGTDGVARLMDFGVAKAAARQSQTRLGQVKGKVSYMSPEQVLGHDVDRRSDVFAAGIVLWEALTGKRLFDGEERSEIAGKVLHSVIIPPSRFRREVPAALERVVLSALERERSHRFPTAADMADAIEECGIALARSREVGRYVEQQLPDQIGKRRESIRVAQRRTPVETSSGEETILIKLPATSLLEETSHYQAALCDPENDSGVATVEVKSPPDGPGDGERPGIDLALGDPFAEIETALTASPSEDEGPLSSEQTMPTVRTPEKGFEPEDEPTVAVRDRPDPMGEEAPTARAKRMRHGASGPPTQELMQPKSDPPPALRRSDPPPVPAEARARRETPDLRHLIAAPELPDVGRPSVPHEMTPTAEIQTTEGPNPFRRPVAPGLALVGLLGIAAAIAILVQAWPSAPAPRSEPVARPAQTPLPVPEAEAAAEAETETEAEAETETETEAETEAATEAATATATETEAVAGTGAGSELETVALVAEPDQTDGVSEVRVESPDRQPLVIEREVPRRVEPVGDEEPRVEGTDRRRRARAIRQRQIRRRRAAAERSTPAERPAPAPAARSNPAPAPPRPAPARPAPASRSEFRPGSI